MVVEVKTRRGGNTYAFESITPRKQRKLSQLTEVYCREKRWRGDVRVDAVAVVIKPRDVLEITHLVGVL